MRTYFFLLLFSICFHSHGQLREGIAVSNEGDSIRVQIEESKIIDSGIAKGAKFIDGNGEKIKISPKKYSKIIFDTEEYRSRPNKSGLPRFMKLIVDGERIKLYTLYSPYGTYHSSQTPGMSFSVSELGGGIENYYMQRGKSTFVVNGENLRKNPEKFFPGNKELIWKVKNTKRADMDLVLWTKIYNSEN